MDVHVCERAYCQSSPASQLCKSNVQQLMTKIAPMLPWWEDGVSSRKLAAKKLKEVARSDIGKERRPAKHHCLAHGWVKFSFGEHAACA